MVLHLGMYGFSGIETDGLSPTTVSPEIWIVLETPLPRYSHVYFTCSVHMFLSLNSHI